MLYLPTHHIKLLQKPPNEQSFNSGVLNQWKNKSVGYSTSPWGVTIGNTDLWKDWWPDRGWVKEKGFRKSLLKKVAVYILLNLFTAVNGCVERKIWLNSSKSNRPKEDFEIKLILKSFKVIYTLWTLGEFCASIAKESPKIGYRCNISWVKLLLNQRQHQHCLTLAVMVIYFFVICVIA